MPKISEKLGANSARDVKLSGPEMLLFLALLIPVFLGMNVHAQTTKKGWSVSSAPAKSDAEGSLNDAEIDKSASDAEGSLLAEGSLIR